MVVGGAHKNARDQRQPVLLLFLLLVGFFYESATSKF